MGGTREEVGKRLSVDAAPGVELTEMEWRIIGHLADGRRDQDIGVTMETTARAIKQHIYRMCNRTGCATRAGLVAFAFRNGVIT